MSNVYLRHVRYRDVCIFVPFLRSFGGHIKAKGGFWNLAGYDMHIATKVDITEHERGNWLYGFSASHSERWRPL